MAENNFLLMSGGNLLYPILRKCVKHFIVYIIKVQHRSTHCRVQGNAQRLRNAGLQCLYEL